MPCDNAQRYKDLLKIYKEHSSQLQTHASECLLEISTRPLKLDMANAKLFFFWYSFLPFLSCPKWFPSFALPVSVHILSSIQCPSHKNIVNFSSGFSPCSSNPSLHHHSLVQATFVSPWDTASHRSPSFHSCQHCNPARVISFKHEPDGMSKNFHSKTFNSKMKTDQNWTFNSSSTVKGRNHQSHLKGVHTTAWCPRFCATGHLYITSHWWPIGLMLVGLIWL